MIIPCKDYIIGIYTTSYKLHRKKKNRNYDVIYLTENIPHNVQGLMPRENRHV